MTLAMGTQAMPSTGNQTHGQMELSNSNVSPFSVVNVGGGTWDYGTGASGSQKHCWSHYNHPDNYHSSTAKVGTSIDKKYANAGSYSLADVYGPQGQTGYAYWDNEAVPPSGS
ncbi:bacteriocin [Paenibacillus alba]|nr:bacteriocin [Paenibacillus alba]